MPVSVAVAVLAFPRTGLGLTYLVFLTVLGLGYEWCHYLIHSDYKPRTALYRAIWKNHRQHHFKNEHYWFTVTSSGTADRVLGTYPDAGSGRHLTDGEESPRALRLNDDGVADADGVVVPGGVVGAQVDAAVADVRIALGRHRPRRAVHVDAAPGDADGVVHGELVALRGR